MPGKQGQLSRADLLRVLLAKDEASQQVLADALGVEWGAPELGVQASLVDDIDVPFAALHRPLAHVKGSNQFTNSDQLANPSPTALLSSAYWQLLEQKNRDDDVSDEEQVVVNQRPVWRNKPERPSFPALMSEADIQRRLLPCLRQDKATQRVDVERLMEQASRAEFITELPVKRQRRDTQALQIIDDRQVHLMPYWLDHSWLTFHLMGVMPEYRLSRAVIEQGEVEPQSIQHYELDDYQLPPEGSTILLMSDLGVLAGRLPAYQRLLDQWLAQGYQLVVVTPCHAADYSDVLASRVTLVSWEAWCDRLPEKGAADDEAPCPRQEWAETLLTLCSAAVRVEPELLRSVRYSLNKHLLSEGKPPLPAAAESLAWQHHSVIQKHSVAATVDSEANKRWQASLKQTSPALKQTVFGVMREWRAILPDEIWFEEFLAVDCCADDELRALSWFKEDASVVEAFFHYVNQRALSGAGLSAEQLPRYQAWMHRVSARMTEAVVSEGCFSESVQLCLQQITDDQGNVPGGHVLDPRLTAPAHTSRVRQSAWLCQLGNRLVVKRHDAFEIPRQRSSLIARLDYRELQLKVVRRGQSFKVDLPEQLGDTFIPLAGTEGLVPQSMRLQTDLTELTLEGFRRPAWAKRVGRDAYGVFAELEIPSEAGRELVQCFRWIPAGTFMMGSPESEAERSDWEDYHQVTLTRGYWLADTAVTQAVWVAVMGDNPARFSENVQCPVEQVSWNDSDEFIRRLAQLIGKGLLEQHPTLRGTFGENALRLPIKAEWEYACRAGTTTPFYFGESISSEKVNFDGSMPYNNGPKSEGRNKTVAVKSLPANQWGLYEMHGNVWEWCADAWNNSMGSQSVVDPCHSGGDDADRVLRGGSWAGNGRFVRSAYRDFNLPDGRSDRIGFRLSLGHELKARSAKKKG